MKFEKITIQPLYPTGNFTNIRIGVDISLEGNDDPKVAMATALDLANEFHKEKFPDLYKENKPIYQGEEKIPEIQVDKPEGTMIEQMEASTTYADIQSFRFTVKNEEEKVVYERKLNELSPKNQ